jgi:formiminotetrahydrofolate cyclodeaminase
VLNAAVISDVMVGAIIGRAALEAAAVNVEVNLVSLRERATVERLRQALHTASDGAWERTERVVEIGRSRFGG